MGTIAEDAGFDSVMISEHIVLGPDASDKGVMATRAHMRYRATRIR